MTEENSEDDFQGNDTEHFAYIESNDDESTEFSSIQLQAYNFDSENNEYICNINELDLYFRSSDDENNDVNQKDEDEPKTGSNSAQSCTVFVGNLPQNSSIDESFFRDFLSNYSISEEPNSIKIKQIINFYGIPYSYALIKLENKEKAKELISKYNYYCKIEDIPIHIILKDEETKSILRSNKGCILMENIPPEIDDNQLYNEFSNYGEVIYCYIQQQLPLKGEESKCMSCGYIYFRNIENAKQAVIDLKGASINKIPIHIKLANQKEDETFKTLFIQNLPENCDDEYLNALFSKFGKLTSYSIFHEENFGFCTMNDHNEAVKAIEELKRKEEDKPFCCRALSFNEIRKNITEIKLHQLQIHIEKMRKIQNIIIDFLDEIDVKVSDQIYLKLIELLNQYKFDNVELKSFLYLIMNISNNHHRVASFYTKILNILQIYKDQIMQMFSNEDMFNFFKRNKRILLYLIEEKIMNIDENIAQKMIEEKFQYSKYFYPEIKSIIKTIDDLLEKDLEEFDKKRNQGENSSRICQIIRNDDLDEFIIFINENSIELTSSIPFSIYETNEFLINNQTKLVEYAAFFGSIKIFNYLKLNNVQMTPFLSLYSIHGNNTEIIQKLEERNIFINEQISKFKCLEESIKCFHKDIVDYVLETFNVGNHFEEYAFHYYNYDFFPKNFYNYYIFDFAIKSDNFLIVQFLIEIQRLYICLNKINRN